MYSIAILSTVLVALIATTNALNCRPVTCMIACPFGFELDTEGCPRCSCRQQANICRDPIFAYNCGTLDHRDCPSSHECQLNFGGFSGQCCLKPPSSSTSRPATGTSTARPVSTTPRSGSTTARATSTRRIMNRLFAFAFESTTGASGTNVPRSTTEATGSHAPGSTTQNSGTTDHAAGSTTDSSQWFNFNF